MVTILYVRSVAMKFLRTDQYDAIGSPIYSVSQQTWSSTYAPKNLKGKPNPLPLSTNISDYKTLEQVDFDRVGDEALNVYKSERRNNSKNQNGT